MDCYEGIRKAREECNNADINSSKSKDEDEDEASGVEHSNEDVKDGNEQICEGPSGKKKRGKRYTYTILGTQQMGIGRIRIRGPKVSIQIIYKDTKDSLETINNKDPKDNAEVL
ncbi:unnamed protein product [Arctogadus glacialis]